MVSNKYLISLLRSSENTNTGLGLFVLRIAISVFMVSLHGWHKVNNYSAVLNDFPELISLEPRNGLSMAIFAEVFCSLFLAFGLFTRIVAIPLCITMFVAALIFNAEQAFIVKEKPLLYFIVYVSLFVMGAGRYSVDRLIVHLLVSRKNH